MLAQIITLFPEMFSALNYGIPRIAQEKNELTLSFVNPRDFTNDKHRTIDDKPYGGGPGMIMKVEPLRSAIQYAKKESLLFQKNAKPHVIYVSPQGKTLDQEAVKKLSFRPSVIFIAGRYEGIDERIIQHDIDEEISIGDFVLSGGELPIMVIIDALCRLIPGVLGDEDSAAEDSFSQGLLDHPHYTRPERVDNQLVPKELLNGNHLVISRWRKKQSLGQTWLKRPDLLEKLVLSNEDKQLLVEFQNELKLENKHE